MNATVKTIEGLSGHADRKELIGWMNKLAYKPQAIYIVHGEEQSSAALKEAIETEYKIKAEIARMDMTPAIS